MILCFDCETSTQNKGNPYDQSNSLVVSGFLMDNVYREFYHDDHSAHIIRWLFNSSTLVVTFNGKFDLNWIRKTYGIQYIGQVWDVQLAHYITTNQQEPYPSLDGVSACHGLGQKHDIIKTEYWDKGINTDAIPRNVLSAYLEQDVLLTYACYLKQKDVAQKRLILQSGWDMLSLAEMEFNGMMYDCGASLEEASEVQAKINELDKKLAKEVECDINWSSPSQVSKVLYGGTIEIETEEEYLFHYKDTKKLPVMKKRKRIHGVTFPIIVSPLKSHQEESYSIDEGTLKKIKPTGKAKRIVDVMQERAKLMKVIGTYLRGIPDKNKDYNWETNMIHGSLNQVRVVTGRLSSEKPNMQNMPDVAKKFFTSRF